MAEPLHMVEMTQWMCRTNSIMMAKRLATLFQGRVNGCAELNHRLGQAGGHFMS